MPPPVLAPATATSEPSLRHISALDGLRGLAVVGVLAFHAGVLPGGFLGVDLFFVLSGFLITSLLVVEHAKHGRISVCRFWARRARRLLPALLVVLAGVAAYAWLVADATELARIRGDALATLGYVANWREVVAGRSYWDLFAVPSPLEHTWSLAIEEQFYLVWPVLVAVVLRATGGSRRVLLGVTGGLLMASAVAMALVHRPLSDPSRVYFGTDTRAAGILIGAVAALLMAGRPSRSEHHARRRPIGVADALGAAALVGIVAVWTVARGTSGWLYEGGLLAHEVGVVIVIWVVARPDPGLLGRLLAWRPLRALGLVSYGLYLWHWPVFVVMSSDRVGINGTPLLAARLAVSLVLCVASYFLIEQPVRRGALTGWRFRAVVPAATTATAVVVVVATIGGVSGPLTPASASRAELPLAVEPQATSGAADAAILVVGDSGALSFGRALEHVAATHGTQTITRGTIGCGVMRTGDGTVSEEDGAFVADPSDCDNQFGRWFNEVESVRPGVVVLLLGWPGLGLRELDGRAQHACQPGFDAYYRDEVDTALSTLSHAGAHVAVATVPPAIRPKVTAADAAARAACLNDIYVDAAHAHPRASVVDLAGWACPEGGCQTELNGTVLRPDGVHFEGPGATLAAEWALPQLSELATPDDALSVLVAGDSTALVLAFNFPSAAHPDIVLSGSAGLGCGITDGTPVSGDVVVETDCNHMLPEYRRVAERDRPRVVVLMTGAWETLDHLVDDQVVRFGEAAWERLIREGLTAYVEAGVEAGARVVLLTAPCFHVEPNDQIPTDQRNDPERVNAFNEIVRAVAVDHPGDAVAVDYGSFVCDGGRPTADLEDGVHLTRRGTARVWDWLAPRLRLFAAG